MLDAALGLVILGLQTCNLMLQLFSFSNPLASSFGNILNLLVEVVDIPIKSIIFILVL